MFGYVRPRQSDLLVRENDFYRAVYCGVCRAMKKTTGRLSTATLSYDIVFFALVRMLYGEREALSCRACRCIAHPCRKRQMTEGHPALALSARVSALLSYYKLKDDLADDGFFRTLPKRLALPALSRARKRARLKEEEEPIRRRLAELRALERAKVASVDRPADLCGQMLGDLFRADFHEGGEEDARLLYDIGYELGRFVYAADAADDYADDCKTGAYNPYRYMWGDGGLTSEQKRDIHMGLTLSLERLEAAILKLPFADAKAVENIIKNTVYLGLPDRIAFLLEDGEDDPSSARESAPAEE